MSGNHICAVEVADVAAPGGASCAGYQLHSTRCMDCRSPEVHRDNLDLQGGLSSAPLTSLEYTAVTILLLQVVLAGYFTRA